MLLNVTGNSKDIKHYKETKARLQKADRQSYWNFIDNIIEVGDPEQEHQPKQKRFCSFVKFTLQGHLWCRTRYRLRKTTRRPKGQSWHPKQAICIYLDKRGQRQHTNTRVCTISCNARYQGQQRRRGKAPTQAQLIVQHQDQISYQHA